MTHFPHFLRKAAALLFFCACASVFAQSEPQISKFDGEIMREISEAQNDSAKEEIFTNALKDKNAGATLFFNAANFYANKAQYDTAMPLYSQAVSLHKGFFLAQKNLALCAISSNSDTALEELKKAIALCGATDPQLMLQLVRIHVKNADYPSALAACDVALAYEPSSEDLMTARAVCLYETEEFRKAQKVCEVLLAKNQNNEDAWNCLFASVAKQEDYTLAVSLWEAKRKLFPQTTPHGELAADMYFNLKLYSKACALYLSEPALREASAGGKKLIKVAKALYAAGELDECVKFCDDISKTCAAPAGVEALEIRLFAVSAKGAEDADILTLCDEILKLKPSSSYAAFELGKIKLEGAKYLAAAEYFEKSAKDENLFLNSMLLKSRACIGAQRYEDAYLILKKANEKMPSGEISEYLKTLGEFLERRNGLD